MGRKRESYLWDNSQVKKNVREEKGPIITTEKEMTETKDIFYLYEAHENLREAMGVQEEYRTRTLFKFFGK